MNGPITPSGRFAATPIIRPCCRVEKIVACGSQDALSGPVIAFYPAGNESLAEAIGSKRVPGGRRARYMLDKRPSNASVEPESRPRAVQIAARSRASFAVQRVTIATSSSRVPAFPEGHDSRNARQWVIS